MKDNGDGTYDIRYDDGDSEENVAGSLIRGAGAASTGGGAAVRVKLRGKLEEGYLRKISSIRALSASDIEENPSSVAASKLSVLRSVLKTPCEGSSFWHRLAAHLTCSTVRPLRLGGDQRWEEG